MQWPLVQYRKFVSLFFASQLLTCEPAFGELDEKRLWLPANYNRLFLDLRDAAKAAQSLDRCVEILQGTIDIDESSVDKPIFRFLCRQNNGRTYNELVDGTTLKTLTTVIVVTPVPSAEELEALRLEEERLLAEQKLARIRAQWENCFAEISAKVSLMSRVSWKSPLPAKPRDLEGGAIEFLMDFDAESVQGRPLHYHARCQFLADGEMTTKIYARK